MPLYWLCYRHNNQISVVIEPDAPECLTANFRARLLRLGQWEDLAMKTTILAYVIALGGVAIIALGLWGLYILIKERVAERRLRDYVPTIQTIAVGFGLIGVAQALRLLLLIWDWEAPILFNIHQNLTKTF